MREFMTITKALADENRVRILMFLRTGELCVCQVIEMLRLAPSTVSKHLSILRQAGLVEVRKNGRWIYYRLPGEGESSEAVRRTLDWVRNSLNRDMGILTDDRRLEAVRKMCMEDLCVHYLNGSRQVA